MRAGAGRHAAGFAAFAIGAVLVGIPRYAEAITILDAQTFLLSPGKKVRLFDVVTPQGAQCGCAAECLLAQRARAFVQQTLARADGEIRVQSFGFDADGTARVKLFVNSRDLSMLMIQNGFARLATGGSPVQWCPG